MKRAVLILIVVVAVVAALGYAFRYFDVGSGFSRTSTTTESVSPPAGNAPGATPRADISIDPRRQQLIGVRTAPARRVSLAQTIRATGNVRADESRQTDINLKVEGWIRDLYVDYTGQAVRRGQPLFT
ncbi:MAG TPA: efflux RND transporter periplasmic adaptor subunit, partial [Vicinamibacterales bacterium]